MTTNTVLLLSILSLTSEFFLNYYYPLNKSPNGLGLWWSKGVSFQWGDLMCHQRNLLLRLKWSLQMFSCSWSLLCQLKFKNLKKIPCICHLIITDYCNSCYRFKIKPWGYNMVLCLYVRCVCVYVKMSYSSTSRRGHETQSEPIPTRSWRTSANLMFSTPLCMLLCLFVSVLLTFNS